MAATGWRSIHDLWRILPPAMITAVLAGGAGRRFGGGEKGLALFRGKPMVAWALDAGAIADSIVIIAN
ncbi:MAG: NTP transferase domain-containing protein, partial [Nitrospinota bacterium]|nr:NTP transferase domain-containing protein [Nitrospinota bacterium]